MRMSIISVLHAIDTTITPLQQVANGYAVAYSVSKLPENHCHFAYASQSANNRQQFPQQQQRLFAFDISAFVGSINCVDNRNLWIWMRLRYEYDCGRERNRNRNNNNNKHMCVWRLCVWFDSLPTAKCCQSLPTAKFIVNKFPLSALTYGTRKYGSVCASYIRVYFCTL